MTAKSYYYCNLMSTRPFRVDRIEVCEASGALPAAFGATKSFVADTRDLVALHIRQESAICAQDGRVMRGRAS